MKTKHTKGEWFVSGGNQIVSMPSQCKITNRVSGWSIDEAEANARLISAAPELLQALESLVFRLEYLAETGRIVVNKSETLREIEIAKELIKKTTK